MIAAAVAACGGSEDPVLLFERGEYEDALRLFRERAADGDIVASNYVGMHYYMGVGIDRDFEEAARWFEKAALAEHPGAQRNLGVMYLRGLGVEQDNHQAYGWMYYAHEGGSPGANDYLQLLSDNITPNASNIAKKRIRALIDAAADAPAAE